MQNRSDNGNIYNNNNTATVPHTVHSHHWDGNNNNMSLALKYTIRYRALFIFRLLNEARNRNNREMRAQSFTTTPATSAAPSRTMARGNITVPMFFPRTPLQRSKFVENEIYSSSFWKSLRYNKPKWMKPRGYGLDGRRVGVWLWINARQSTTNKRRSGYII